MSVQPTDYGMVFHVMIHAAEEEFLMPTVNNVFVHQVTGMEEHVLFALTLKFGACQDQLVFVNKEETGMD